MAVPKLKLGALDHSSAQAPPPLSNRDAIFAEGEFLTPRFLELLDAHCEKKGVPITPRMTPRAAAPASAEAQEDSKNKFINAMLEAEKSELESELVEIKAERQQLQEVIKQYESQFKVLVDAQTKTQNTAVEVMEQVSTLEIKLQASQEALKTSEDQRLRSEQREKLLDTEVSFLKDELASAQEATALLAPRVEAMKTERAKLQQEIWDLQSQLSAGGQAAPTPAPVIGVPAGVAEAAEVPPLPPRAPTALPAELSIALGDDTSKGLNEEIHELNKVQDQLLEHYNQLRAAMQANPAMRQQIGLAVVQEVNDLLPMVATKYVQKHMLAVSLKRELVNRVQQLDMADAHGAQQAQQIQQLQTDLAALRKQQEDHLQQLSQLRAELQAGSIDQARLAADVQHAEADKAYVIQEAERLAKQLAKVKAHWVGLMQWAHSNQEGNDLAAVFVELEDTINLIHGDKGKPRVLESVD